MKLGRAARWLLSLAVSAGSLHAQEAPSARVSGVVTDSVHSTPLVGAAIFASRLAPAPSVSFSAATDQHGRYAFDSLSAGRWVFAVGHPLLDSLDLALPTRELELVAGGRTQLDFALPSGATLRAAACPGIKLTDDAGALMGRVTDAETDRPLPGAVLAVSWSDLTVDPATLLASETIHTEAVHPGATGQYRLCGVPTDSWLLLQVQLGDRGGTIVRTAVPKDAGVALVNLSLSAAATRPLEIPDSTSADSAITAAFTGTASLTGLVLGQGGLPMADVQLRVVDARPRARTDSAGRFMLTSLPAGTQIVEARKIGYRIIQEPVQLHSGRTTSVNLRLVHVVSLDSIRIVAQRNRYPEFERRRRGGFGHFLTGEELERTGVLDISDAVRRMPGFRVAGFGYDAVVLSSRSLGARDEWGRRCGGVNVVIDGMQHQEINWLRPSDVGAIEIYPGAAGAPIQFDRNCGLVIIWTRR